MANGKKGDQQRITAAERRIQVLAYRKTGASFRQIATAIGVSLAQTHDDYRRAIDELHGLQEQSAVDLRTLENARLDDMQVALWPQVRMGNLKAIGMALRIQERRARLNGIDLQPGADLPAELDIILRWHDDRARIIDITPAVNDHAASTPQITESGRDASGALPYRVRWSEMGQEQASGDVEPENGA